MERTTADASIRQDMGQVVSLSGLLDTTPLQSQVISPPTDFRGDAGFVASRVTVQRRPPALAMALPVRQTIKHQKNGSQPDAQVTLWNGTRGLVDGIEADLSLIADLEPNLLAWRVTEMSSRLAAQPELVAQPKAIGGLRVLSYQALMFEHLYILQSTAAEGNA